MFYTRGENTVYIARVGPFKIDLKAIIIAVESTLIVLPLNIILNYLFRHSPRASDIGHHRHTKDWSRHHKHKRNLSLKYKKIGKSNTLSVCWLYLAWIFSFLLSAGSIAIIIMYSLQWGDNKSKQWMLTAFASFGQSFIVIEPVKLLVIAILLAIIVKNHGDDIEVIDVYKEAPQVISQTQHIAQPGQEDPHVLRLVMLNLS